MIKIIYSDNDIAVCEKPVGYSSQLCDKDNMVTELETEFGCSVYPIHRLDTAVGGVMVYAKNQSAAAELTKQIQDKTFIKKYLAVICGLPDDEKGTFEDLLFKDSRKNKTYVVTRMRKGVRDAKLDYEVLESDGKYSLVLVRLHTGRTHQIRVQFASRKMPLLGDGKYGSRDSDCNIALFSHCIEFIHPGTKEKMKFELLPDYSSEPWKKILK